MQTLTYKQSRDKIIDAYFKNEIEPYHRDFCFCGTLAGGHERWSAHSDMPGSPYRSHDYDRMEKALLGGIQKEMNEFFPGISIGGEGCDAIKHTPGRFRDMLKDHPHYEHAVFVGMETALEVLKQIHIERGEIIDDVPEFTKRDLLTIFS